jgi:hypothetical protein
VLGSILKRPALRGISEDDFRAVAAYAGVLLLLDGWNELHPHARTRARVQVERLKAELPELGLIISTRRQALDVPFVGARVDLMPLNEAQQIQIATSMRGEAGARLIDQAWRTAGVRELVTIPLYLTALLSLPENEPFPTTKEQILRHFVAVQETEVRRAEALRATAQGLQQDYLDRLAVLATQTANTTIADSSARGSISDTAALLASNGQIATKPEPEAVLDVLVSNHVLTRAGDTQFQEWYASHSVERRIIAAATDPSECAALKAEILDLPAWEEPILFAVERLARGDRQQMAACSNAILTAFAVDPILAAEMIFRSTDEVWAPIASQIRELITRWHAPGMVDRAVRFMLVSGRPEFFGLVWPLITHENEQISLTALRNCRRFRPSILGKSAEQKIKGLPTKIRIVLLSEIASHSAMDGLDLAAAIARDDPDPGVQASVVDALAFRRADRHIAEVLRKASDKTYDLVVRKGLVDVADEHVRKGLGAARQRQITGGLSDYDRLRAIAYTDDGQDRSAELRDIVSSMKIEQQRQEVQLIYEARNRYPRAVADGLLARVLAGRTLFYGADDILASAGFVLEDEALLEVALAETGPHDDRAEAAASVLGPQAVARMIDTLLGLRTRLGRGGSYDRAASEVYNGLQSRIAHTPGASLVAAIQARSAEADNEQIVSLADLLSRHPNGDDDRGRPFDADARTAIQDLAEDWGNRMLASADAKRWQLARIAALVSHAPSVRLLHLLRRLLDRTLTTF